LLRYSQSALKRLRDEVAALESVLYQLSGPNKRAKDSNEHSLSTDISLTVGTACEDLIDNLHQTLALKQRLKHDRAQLRQQFIESCGRW
jgi:flagellar biosynthesis chaperone FliJ